MKQEGDLGLGWRQFEIEACFSTNKHIFGAHLELGLSAKAFSSRTIFFFDDNRMWQFRRKPRLFVHVNAMKNANLICDN